MGYTTQFSGHVTIEPECDLTLFKKLRYVNDNDTRDWEPEEELPDLFDEYAYRCDWRVLDNGTALTWDGGEKFYDADQWMKWLIDKLIAPTGRVVNGEILAQGEEAGDVWMIIVKDNRVTRAESKMAFNEGTPV